MFAVFVILFAANFLAAENFVIPNVVEESSISIQSSTSENIVENALENTMSMGSSMQSTMENVEMNITDIDSPLENLVEEIAEETELDITEDVTEMGSGIENISENMELLSENIEEVVSSPMQTLESSITENITSEMGSLPISPTMMGSELLEETTSNIRELQSTIPSMQYGTGRITPMQNMPSTNTLSTMEELEIMSNIENMMPYSSGTGPLSSMTSQTGGNYMSPSMPSIPGMGNLPPNMPHLSNMRPSASITSPGGGNYMSSSMPSIPGMGNLPPNMPYPSMTGLTSPVTSTMQQLESQISRPSSTMPYLENIPPGMSLSPTSSFEEMGSEFDYNYSSPSMMPNMGNSPMPSYRPNMGLLSPITSTIKEMESEIEESSIPLMNLINQSPIMPDFPGPVLALPSLGSTLEELEDVTTSNIPLLGTMSGGGSLPMRPNTPNMQDMDAFMNVPSVGSALGQLEKGINSAALPLMETMPIIGSSLPMLRKPSTMGGYSTNLPNEENMQPFGQLPSGNMGYPSGSRLPFINSIMSPLQNLPLMNRFVSPLMSNLSNMQQSMMPGNQKPMPNGGLFSPLRQAMSNFKMAPSLLQQPLMSNIPNMGPANSMSSNTGLSELTLLLNQDSMLPSSQKNQLLGQMSNLGPSSLSMMLNMYNMMGNDWQTRLRRQIEKVRQARRELMEAMEAVMSGHPEEVPRHVMAAIAALGNSPMTTALQYALNQDRNSLPLIANISRLILDRVQ